MDEAEAVAALGEEAVPTPVITPEAGLMPIRVVVPTGDNLTFMSLWIALGAGFFRDEGLDIQVIMHPNPLGTGQFLIQGRADISVLPDTQSLDLIGKEAPILLFANLLQNDPINLVVRKEVAEERQLSLDAPLAERLNAMRGLKIGVAPGPPVRLRVLFESVGLDADSDIEMVIIQGAEQNQAFDDGRVDALYAHTPYLERALVQQGAVLIVNQSAGEVPELANRQIQSLVTTQSYASANPDILMALTRAIHRAQQLVHTDQQAAVSAILQSGVPGLDRKLVETIVAIYAPAIPLTPEVSVEGVKRAHDLFPAQFTPSDLSGIDLGEYVAREFAEEAVSTTPVIVPPPTSTPTPTALPRPTATATPTPTPRSLGSVVSADTECPDGSREGSQCRMVVVTCPDIDEASAQLRLSRPAADVTYNGTIVLTAGGPGTFLYYGSAEDIPGKMVDTFVNDGFLTVDIKWEEPSIWEGSGRAVTLACRYATVARWIYDNLHEGGKETLFVTQGTSGGAAQIAFGLAYYGLDEIIDLANLGGGPPRCPICGRTPRFSRESLLSRDPRVNYPSTTVRFFLGENETQNTIDAANEYYNAITSEKTMQRVPNAEHNDYLTPEGTAALIAAVREAMTAQ